MRDSIQQPKDAAMTARVTELFNNLTDAQQQALLSILEDWQHSERRKHPRQSWVAPVDYATEDRAFKDFTKDISTGGMFIETRTPFSIGQQITLTFSPSNSKEPIKITGQIVWTGSLGIGVKFKKPNQDLEALIKFL